MFVSDNQFKYACVMFAFGYLCALIADVRYGVCALIFGKRFAKFTFTVYAAEATATFLYAFIKMKMPSLRAYMPICFLLGAVGYMKSLHKLLAIIYKYCYNIINNCKTRLKSKLKSLKDKLYGQRRKRGRAEEKTYLFSRRGDSGDVAVHTSVVYGVSDVRHRRKKTQDRRTQRADSRA